MSDGSLRPVVYTALMGEYEELNEQPVSADSACRFVCFTDDPRLVSSTWEVHVVEPRFVWDPTRSAREIKICPPPIVRDQPASLWVDNRIRLREPPETLVPRLLKNVDIALPMHSFRVSVGDEFDAVLSHGFDRAERVREQLHYLTIHAPHVLDARPFWTAILARRHSDRLDAAMTSWWFQVLRHSRRDQLSVNWALQSHPDVRVNAFEVDNFSSDFHEWLTVVKSEQILRDRGFRYGAGQDASDRWRTSRAGEKLRRARALLGQTVPGGGR